MIMTVNKRFDMAGLIQRCKDVVDAKMLEVMCSLLEHFF